MKLSKETEQMLIMKLLALSESENSNMGSFYKVGKDFVIRTVTMIYLGEIKSENADSLILTNCAWIPDTSRWNEFLKGKKPNEMEPYKNDVIVYKAAILDATEMTNKIKREVL